MNYMDGITSYSDMNSGRTSTFPDGKRDFLETTTERKPSSESSVREKRKRGNWSASPLWETKILLGVLKQQGLVGKGLVSAFEKWSVRIVGYSRAELNEVYRGQTGSEMSDYILGLQADKAVRYNQLPPQAEAVRQALKHTTSVQANDDAETAAAIDAVGPRGKSAFSLPGNTRPRSLLDDRKNLLLSTNELADLTGFKAKTIRRWVAQKRLNYVRVGNRLRFRPAAVELFLSQHETLSLRHSRVP